MSDTLALLAAELALGLLPASERVDAERLRTTDRNFAAEVALWETMAEGWVNELADQPPSPQLWQRVAGLIAPDRAPSGAAVATPRPAASPAGPGVWRPLAIAASLLACLFAGLWLSRPNHARRSAPSPASATAVRFSIAQIGSTGDPHLATVLYDRDSRTLTIRIAASAADPAKAPEIWLINGTQPPHSLGFGNAGAETRMQANARLQGSLVDGATLAITLEPFSAQPHAAPSSKILGTGTISSI